jgi:sigma-B regulation protein RsbU (phosphoserine phosphatase)
VRGGHQLSGLAASFNDMSTKILQLIGAVRKKEKLDAELRIAREVQLRLFPKSVPKLRTLEMAGVCLPGRVVSGDYYDYLTLDDRRTAIALADVSGKGVSAALLMASIQAALHAQLKFSGASSHPAVSTATLMALISQQLYENTPTEKYATFFYSVYDEAAAKDQQRSGARFSRDESRAAAGPELTAPSAAATGSQSDQLEAPQGG